MVEPAVMAAVLTIIFAVVSGLVGLAYRNLLKRVRDLESDTNTREGKHNGLAQKVDTIWRFLFGVEDDHTDTGLSGEIQDGFDTIEDELEETQSQQEEYHTREMDAIENLANELHDEEGLDINREDVLPDD
jgi:hypothetical protein